MKKVIYLLLVLSCIGCQTLSYIPGYEVSLGLDFRPYAEKGFLFTPHGYAAGEYTTISMIDYTVMPKAKYTAAQYSKAEQGRVQTGSGHWNVDEVSTQALLDSIYNMCTGMGADALIDFSNEVVTMDYSTLSNPVTIQGVRITGLAIKRED